MAVMRSASTFSLKTPPAICLAPASWCKCAHARVEYASALQPGHCAQHTLCSCMGVSAQAGWRYRCMQVFSLVTCKRSRASTAMHLCNNLFVCCTRHMSCKLSSDQCMVGCWWHHVPSKLLSACSPCATSRARACLPAFKYAVNARKLDLSISKRHELSSSDTSTPSDSTAGHNAVKKRQQCIAQQGSRVVELHGTKPYRERFHMSSRAHWTQLQHNCVNPR
jgi:hypothetical protein